MRIVVAVAGIGGLTAALSLYAAGIRDVRIVEAAPRLEPLGVGLNLLPNAVRELAELGLFDALAARSVSTSELLLFNRFGSLIWSEPRGLAAGCRWPQLSIHRGALQAVLVDAVRARHDRHRRKRRRLRAAAERDAARRAGGRLGARGRRADRRR